MILFKENDKITKNVITGEKLKLIKLLESLTDKNSFKYHESVEFIGHELPDYNKNNLIYIQNNRLGHNGNGGLGNIYIRNKYVNPKAQSTIIVSEALKSVSSQQKNTIWLSDFFEKDRTQAIMLENLLASLDPKTLKYVMTNFWEDFDYFCMQILSLIRFEQVGEYEVSDFKKDTIMNIETPTSSIPEIEENVRILKLAKKMKNKRI